MELEEIIHQSIRHYVPRILVPCTSFYIILPRINKNSLGLQALWNQHFYYFFVSEAKVARGDLSSFFPVFFLFFFFRRKNAIARLSDEYSNVSDVFPYIMKSVMEVIPRTAIR